MNIEVNCCYPEAQTIVPNPAPALPPVPKTENGCVRLGGQAPLFQPEIADKGQVRLGGQSPLFLPPLIADAGLVRLGGQRPTF